MTSIFTQNRPYAGLNVADDAKSHVLYFTPLEEVQKSLRVDGTSVVVVTMIGKCSHPKNLLSNLIADQSSFIIMEEAWLQEHVGMSQLEAYYDRQHGTIYINMLSVFEDSAFLNACEKLGDMLKNKSATDSIDVEAWLEAQEMAEVKLLLHAFLLSNVIFLVQTGNQFDTHWFEVLKNVAFLHMTYSTEAEKKGFKFPAVKRLLEGPKPSLAVVFDVTPLISAKERPQISQIETFFQETHKKVEMQVKQLLRRPLFDCLFQLASPQHANVVWLGDSPMMTVVRMIDEEEGLPVSDSLFGIRPLRKWLVSKTRSLHGSAHFLPAFHPPAHTQPEPENRKRKGIVPSKTLTDGYLLATGLEWFELSYKVLKWLEEEPAMTATGTEADFIFSEETCRHAFECASATYFTGLSPMYGSLYHEKRMQMALKVYASLARGPSSFHTKSRLIHHCATYWNQGHRKCDALSLTHRPCVHSYHLTKVEEEKAILLERRSRIAQRPLDGDLTKEDAGDNGMAESSDRMEAREGTKQDDKKISSLPLPSTSVDPTGGANASLTSHLDVHVEKKEYSASSKMMAELAASAPTYSPSTPSQSSSLAPSPLKLPSLGDTSPTATTHLLSAPASSSASSLGLNPPTLQHCSKFKALHRCNCGKSQKVREDPFDLFQANTCFYLHSDCCRHLPSLLEGKYSTMKPKEREGTLEGEEGVLSRSPHRHPHPHPQQHAHASWEAIVIGPTSEAIEREANGNEKANRASSLPPSPSAHPLVLPQGGASLVGQTGFVEGYASLLRWSVKSSFGAPSSAPNPSSDLSDASTVPTTAKSPRESKVSSSGQPHTLTTPSSSPTTSDPLNSDEGETPLDAYLGFEYECQAGHRWLATPTVFAALGLVPPPFDPSAPDLDLQHLLESSYIPIYCLCTCGKKTAQLQRLYIATPLHPSLRITFNLLVQIHGKATQEGLDALTPSSEGHQGRPPKIQKQAGDRASLAPTTTFNAKEIVNTPDKTHASPSYPAATPLPRIHLDSGLSDHLILPPGQLICLRLPYIYAHLDEPLIQEKMTYNSECRFFLEPHSFGLVAT